MIRFYCQYSYGGFRTYRISGVANEQLADNEVTCANRQELPDMADLYFNYGGAKLVYRELDNGEIALIVREIPGIERDTEGRIINCAVEIIGTPDDKPLLDKLTLWVATNLADFEKEFAEGFSLRGGLHYDGEFLTSLLGKLDLQSVDTDSTMWAGFAAGSGPVWLFVPTSPRFNSDKKLSSKVVMELRLGQTSEQIQATLANTLLPDQLAKATESIRFSETSSEPPHSDPPVDTVTADPGEMSFTDLLRRNEELENTTRQQKATIDSLKNEIAECQLMQSRSHRLMLLMTAGCGIFVLGLIISLLLN